MSAKIKFTDVETNEEIEFDVIEETKVNNINYLLVTESNEAADENGEETAYILKDLSGENDAEANYVMVEEDDEIEYISKIFGELLDDVELN